MTLYTWRRGIDPDAPAVWRPLDRAVAQWVLVHGGSAHLAEVAAWASHADGLGDAALPLAGADAGRHGMTPPSAEQLAELRAQARQIVEDRKVPRSGDIEYRFTEDGAIRTLLVNADLRTKLSSGALVIARLDDRYELLPRAAADKVRERDAGMIVLDHGQHEAAPADTSSEDDAYYAQFKVPDDLIW